MTAPATDLGGDAAAILNMEDDEFQAFEQEAIGKADPPPKPTEPPAVTEAPAKEAGASASEEAEEVEVELTEEQADQERVSAGWKRNEKTGQWQKPNGQFAKANELPDAPEEKAEAPKVESRKLLAEFSIKDAEGNEYDAQGSADAQITYKANGKEVTRSLDHLVKMAQRGEYNEQQHQELKQREDRAMQAEAQFTSLKAEYERLQRWTDSILQDTDEANERIMQARERYARTNSPEMREERIARREREFEERQRSAQTAHQSKAVIERMATAIDGLPKQYPSVTPEEVIGKYNILIAPLLVNGLMPPEKLSEAERLVATELAQWAESVHEQRDARVRTEREKADAEIKKANGRVIAAKRQVARVWKPATGQAGSLNPSKPNTSANPKLSAEEVARLELGLPED